MSYIDSINETIKSIEGKIKELNKIKRNFKKEKQQYCSHTNIVRFTKMPKMSYSAFGDAYAPFDTIKVKTKCKDCGKIL